MGPGLVSADWMVRVSLWFISRGAQFVPASYTPFAYLHCMHARPIHSPRLSEAASRRDSRARARSHDDGACAASRLPAECGMETPPH
eukprot:scaffold113090_cov37-Tisochrysis_lutea.AAC.2